MEIEEHNQGMEIEEHNRGMEIVQHNQGMEMVQHNQGMEIVQHNQGMELVVAVQQQNHQQKSKGIAPRGPLIEPNKVVEAPKELNLPDGWTYEEVPRTNPKYFGKIDKYYYEPGTSMKFRTYQSVLRHLQSIKGEQRSEPTKLANGMKFKSAIAAKRAARQILKNED